MINLRHKRPNRVLFDEESHRYYLNGKELISTTRLLEKIGVSPDYSKVDTDLLKKSAEYGTFIHSEIEEFIKSDKQSITKEVELFKEWLAKEHYTVIDSEYIVHNDVVAGKVDLLLVDDKTNELVIADIKTTSTIHYESVSWQLSIYAYLERKKVNRALVIHFAKDKLEAKDIKLKNKNDIDGLMESERNGTPYYLPSIDLEQRQIEIIKQAVVGIERAKKEIELYQKTIEDVNSEIIKAMEDNGVKSYENKDFKITYVSPITKTLLDKSSLEKDYPELVKKYTKQSVSKASLRITLKQ